MLDFILSVRVQVVVTLVSMDIYNVKLYLLHPYLVIYLCLDPT